MGLISKIFGRKTDRLTIKKDGNRLEIKYNGRDYVPGENPRADCLVESFTRRAVPLEEYKIDIKLS